MKSSKASTTALAALVVAAALTGACGEQADPYAITCGHVRDQQKWADVTRRATIAIADRERFRDLNRLRASQSLYFAMTELCKQKARSFAPARAAADGVRDGALRVRPPVRDAG